MAFENDPEGRKLASRYAGPDFDRERVVKHEVLREYGFDGSLQQFLEMVNAAIATIPEECVATAHVEMEDPGYEGSTSLVISYIGPESQDVVDKRVAQCLEYVELERAKERLAYERLKAKFERKE